MSIITDFKDIRSRMLGDLKSQPQPKPKVKVQCPDCEGTGKINSGLFTVIFNKCITCDGEGVV